MNRLTDYIISLTHLYGLVHKDKVIEIYNMQNEDEADVIDLIGLKAGGISIDPRELSKNYVEVFNDYFVHEAIMEAGEFEFQLTERKDKPFYIPDQEELLKYRDGNYFEINKEYGELLEYVTKHLLDGDRQRAEMLVEEIRCYCQRNFSPRAIFDVFNDQGIVFKGENQVNEVMLLVMNLANNTRIWENNGHTSDEIFELQEKPSLRPLPARRFTWTDGPSKKGPVAGKPQPSGKKKIGRNDPCPCGSGKKYKKCCLGKEEIH